MMNKDPIKDPRECNSRPSADVAAATTGERRLKVVAGDAPETGQDFVGPRVEDASSTVIIPAGARAQRDASGNIVVDLEPARAAAGETTTGHLAKVG